MATPLYKQLKSNGTTFYAFPSSAESLSLVNQNPNVTMNFSKFILLNIPPQVITGTNQEQVTFDFDNTFVSAATTGSLSFPDQLVNSIRNFIANYEETIETTLINNNEFFYNNDLLTSTSEKIFWKWAKALNLIQFEQADGNLDYFSNLSDFLPTVIGDTSYQPEILWKERSIITYNITLVQQEIIVGQPTFYFAGQTTFKVGDLIIITGINDPALIGIFGISDPTDLVYGIVSDETYDSINNIDKITVSNINYPPAGPGYYNGGSYVLYNTVGYLNYTNLVQYIGEISGLNNVQESNRNYTEIFAHVPDQNGATPNILFRTNFDANYGPNLLYPIIPSQFQPEIIGAENFNSPIVNSPQNYPGNFYAQYNNSDFQYVNSPGDQLRRIGDYFGVFGDINNPVFDPNVVDVLAGTNGLDGLNIDFDLSHYVKANLLNRSVLSFDEFNGLSINNNPPPNFEFNAILWYYDITDINGNTATNLYGISILDNPNNNPNPALLGIQVPTYKKLASTTNQDGTAYAFSLNLNYNIVNDSIVNTFSPNTIYSLFSFDLFNDAMKRLAQANDSFMQVISDNTNVLTEVNALKSLLYSQTDIDSIKASINNLNNIFTLLQTQQIVTSDTISVEVNTQTSPPTIYLNSIDTQYSSVTNVYTSNMYASTGAIPFKVTPSDTKDLLINIINNDETNLILPNDDRLTLVITTDLQFKQSVEIVIDALDLASENKQLDIFINYTPAPNVDVVSTKVISALDLPVFYNKINLGNNSARTWTNTTMPILLGNSLLVLNPGYTLDVPLQHTYGINVGDTFLLNNLFIAPTGGTGLGIDFTGQYNVVSTTPNIATFDASINVSWSQYYPVVGTAISIENNVKAWPFVSNNKGIRIKITRISDDDSSTIDERYLIQKTIFENPDI